MLQARRNQIIRTNLPQDDYVMCRGGDYVLTGKVDSVCNSLFPYVSSHAATMIGQVHDLGGTEYSLR
jgi:hypothetical protein